MIPRQQSNPRLHRQRRGSVASFLAILMMPMLALLALFVDYGFLLYARTDMQRAADQAALAAVQDLVPDLDGDQDFDQARATARQYVQQNLGDQFVVNDSDIEIGRYNPDSIYTNVELLDNGTADCVRVTVRRDPSANSSISLYFARLFDKDTEDITATAAAVLQRARYMPPGTGIFPFAIPDDQWEDLPPGGEFNLYGDGKIEDGAGNTVPGNWGTVDIGPANNSTNDLRDQIVNGLSQDDLDSLERQGAIADSAHIDSLADLPMTLDADPGLSSGMKEAVEEVQGLYKIAPVYDASAVAGNNGNGNGNSNGNGKGNGNSGSGGDNLTYPIIGWAVVYVADSHFGGSKDTYINVKKGSMYEGNMTPNDDLSDPESGIEGVYTSPVLVQ